MSQMDENVGFLDVATGNSEHIFPGIIFNDVNFFGALLLSS